MIWFRLLALVLVILVTIPLMTFTLSQLLRIQESGANRQQYTLFTATALTFVYYTLLVLSVRTQHAAGCFGWGLKQIPTSITRIPLVRRFTWLCARPS